jgi:hypothetical protein
MPAHSWNYCAALAQSSQLECYLYVGRLREHKVICPVSVRAKEDGYREIVSPYGFSGVLMTSPLVNQQELAEEWEQYWKEQEMVTAYIMQHPLCRLHAEAWKSTLHEGPTLFTLDLKLPLEKLWQNMKNTHRYEIRKLQQKPGVHVVSDKQVLRHALFELYPRTLERVGASEVYNFSRTTLEMLIDMPDALLLGAVCDDTIQAVSLFLTANGAADYFLNASAEEGKKYSRLLLGVAMSELQKRKIPCLNLGGGVRQGDPLESFKRRFGGVPVRGQVIKQIFDRNRYDYLMKYATTREEQRYFPPYWRGMAKPGTHESGGRIA